MEQIAIVEVLRRHVVMIVALCLIATVAGGAFTLIIPNRYTALAYVLVRPQQPIKLGTGKDTSKEFLDFPMGSASSVETASKTYIEIIKSPALIGDVVRELGLDKEKDDAQGGKLRQLLPASLYAPLHELSQSFKRALTFFQYGKMIEDDPFTKAVKSIGAGLSLEATADTYVFQLKYTSSEPKEAADVVNTTAKTLMKFVDELRLSESRHQLDYLKTELSQSRQRVDAARERLERYKQVHAVFLPEKEYDAKLRVISELEVELVKAQESLVGNQSNLSTVSLAARRTSLIRLLAERKAELVSLPAIERELVQLDQDVKDAVASYEIVNKEFKEAGLKESYTMPEVRLVSAGVAPNIPSSPQRPLIALICLLTGLVIGVGLAFLLEYLNRGIRGIQDLEDFVGLKVLATIPRISPRRWQRAGLS